MALGHLTCSLFCHLIQEMVSFLLNNLHSSSLEQSIFIHIHNVPAKCGLTFKMVQQDLGQSFQIGSASAQSTTCNLHYTLCIWYLWYFLRTLCDSCSTIPRHFIRLMAFALGPLIPPRIQFCSFF